MTGTGRTGTATTFWASLGAGDRAELSRLGTNVVRPADTQLLAQGEASDYLIVVLHGWIKVAAHSSGGYRALLALRGPGDLLGEQAGLEGRRRGASLHTATDVSLLQVTADRFSELARRRSSVGRSVEQSLSRRLREADVQRAGITEPVSVRLAAVLLDLCERCGEPGRGPAEVRIGLPLSQDDLAGLVLSSRRSVSRVLEDWRGRGVIVTGRRALSVMSVDRLKMLGSDG